MLHKYCIFTNWRFAATLHLASVLVPFFQQHLLTLYFCHILVIHTAFQTFLLLYLLWWSLISDLWCYGAHEWHSSRMANLIDKCLCSDCSIDQLFSFSLFRHLYSLRHKYILAQIGPINHLTMVSKCSSEESYMSYFKSQGRNVET